MRAAAFQYFRQTLSDISLAKAQTTDASILTGWKPRNIGEITMKIVGYFDGTDSLLLTKLVAKGIGTIPIANDWDGAGKMASHLEPGDVDLIVGYLHKVIAPVREVEEKTGRIPKMYRGLTAYDLLYRANTFDIPTLIIAPKTDHKAAKKALAKAAGFVTLVTPDEVEEKILGILA